MLTEKWLFVFFLLWFFSTISTTSTAPESREPNVASKSLYAGNRIERAGWTAGARPSQPSRPRRDDFPLEKGTGGVQATRCWEHGSPTWAPGASQTHGGGTSSFSSQWGSDPLCTTTFPFLFLFSICLSLSFSLSLSDCLYFFPIPYSYLLFSVSWIDIELLEAVVPRGRNDNVTVTASRAAQAEGRAHPVPSRAADWWTSPPGWNGGHDPRHEKSATWAWRGTVTVQWQRCCRTILFYLVCFPAIFVNRRFVSIWLGSFKRDGDLFSNFLETRWSILDM